MLSKILGPSIFDVMTAGDTETSDVACIMQLLTIKKSPLLQRQDPKLSELFT